MGKFGVNWLNNPECAAVVDSMDEWKKVREPEGGGERKYKTERPRERLMDMFRFGISKRSIKSLVICVSVPPSTRTSQPRAMNMVMRRSLYQNSSELLNRTAIFHWYIWEFDSRWQIDSIILRCLTLRWMALENYTVVFNTPLLCLDCWLNHHNCYQYCNYNFYTTKWDLIPS